MSSPSQAIQSLANAIAQEEGYNVEGSLPNRQNNPGDLTGSDGSILSFDTPEQGFDALYNQLNLIQSGQSKYYEPSETLSQFADTYTGGDSNAGNNLASILGVPASTTLADVLGANVPSSSSLTSKVGSALNNTNSSSSPLSFLADLFGATTGTDTRTPITSDYLVRGVAVLGGLVLIAGAVFGFKAVHETIIESGSKLAKAGAETAEIAA